MKVGMVSDWEVIISRMPFFQDAEVNSVHVQQLVLYVAVMEDFVSVVPKLPGEMPELNDELTCLLIASLAGSFLMEIFMLGCRPLAGESASEEVVPTE